MSRRYDVRCEWDAEAGVWYVAESDVLGLSLEAPTQDELTDKLLAAIPELLALNEPEGDDSPEVPVSLLYTREARLRRRA